MAQKSEYMASEPMTSEPVTSGAPETLYCANHPETETLLRCNRCGKPICLKCAVLTDVGYRCKDCIRNVQNSYYNAFTGDNLIALVVSTVVTAIAAPLVTLLLGMIWLWGFLLAFMLGGSAGGILAQIIRTAIGKRRGRQIRWFALAGIVLGVLVAVVIGQLFGFPILSLQLLIFAVLAGGTANQLLR